MPLPRTVFTALSVERSSLARPDAGAFGRLARSEMNGSPLAVCSPCDDGEFAANVQTRLDGSHPEWPFAAAVQALPLETYPRAVFRPRHALAAFDGGRVCYASSDRSVVPAVDGGTS